jgi:hypothetical protein
MNLGDWLIGVPVALAILYFLIVGLILVVRELVPFVYHAFKHERKGICPECRQPYTRQQVQLADQTYGPSATYQNVCPNGHVGMTHGNRRFADWR